MSDAPRISVIIPAHNPNWERLERTLQGLRQQTLPADHWEMLVIDNRSNPPMELSLEGLPHARIIREKTLGLTHARLCGFRNAEATLFVLVDDDNVLERNYLKAAKELAEQHPQVGIFGGKNLPEFEVPVPRWFPNPPIGLGIRDLGDSPLFGLATDYRANSEYPSCAPVGAGMVLRREIAHTYSQGIASHGTRITDRKGKALSSGGDCDLVMTALEKGWNVGYFPELQLTHLIPSERLTFEYQYRLAQGIMESWVQVLDIHGIRPWPAIPRWSVPLRQLKAWFTHRAWTGRSARLRWQAACGKLEGQARLSDE